MITDNHAVRFACSLPSWPVVFAVLPTFVRDIHLFLVEYVGWSGSAFGLRGHGATDKVLAGPAGPLEEMDDNLRSVLPSRGGTLK